LLLQPGNTNPLSAKQDIKKINTGRETLLLRSYYQYHFITTKSNFMYRHKKLALLIIMSIICGSFIMMTTVKEIKEVPVPYPEGYRQWTHVKTAVVEPGNPAFDHFGGIHHIYANPIAMEGYKSGHFANGAFIVFDVLEAIDTNKLLLEGRRRQLDVMIRDSIRYSTTGGWGFEEFKENSKTLRSVNGSLKSGCYSCHANSKTMVFSQWRQ
jgi:hypothetical protein